MKIQPILSYILVEKFEEEKTTIGLVLPTDTKKLESGRVKVIEVGQGIRREDGTLIPLLVKKGDTILISKFFPIHIKGKEYYLTREDCILAIIKDEAPKSK